MSDLYSFPWRKALIATIVTLVALSGLYGVWWWIVASNVEANIENWIDQYRSEGLDIGYRELNTEGFPFTLHVEISKPFATSGMWKWQSQNVDLYVKPWSLAEMELDLSGFHEGITVLNGKPEPFVFIADELDFGAVFDAGRVVSVNAKGNGLTARIERQNQTVSVAEIDLEFFSNSQTVVNWSMRLRDVRVPKSLSLPMGQRVQRLEVKGQVDGMLKGETLIDKLSNWRDQGGKLEVLMLDLGYAALSVRGDGTLALDSNLQPIGAFAIRARGVLESVDMLAQAGLISRMKSLATKLLLGTLMKTPEGGGERYLDLPVTVQDRVLTAGPFDLLKFPPVHW